MNRHNSTKTISTKVQIYRVIVIAIAIGLISLCLPREESSLYQFEIGRPWRYNSLIATYDFPIYKTSETIAAEQDSILHLFKPYFIIDNNITIKEIEKFKRDFSQPSDSKLTTKEINYIQSRLKEIYSNGVMDSNEYEQLIKNTSGIRVITGTEAISKSTESIFFPKKAYEYLLASNKDSAYIDTERLRAANLDQYITSNLICDTVKSASARHDLLSTLSYASGMVVTGQKIIDRGEIVTEETSQRLSSLEKEYARRNTSKMQIHSMALGQTIYVAIIVICLSIYFSQFRRDYLSDTRSLLFIASATVIFPIATSVLSTHNTGYAFVIPFAMIPIFIRVFMDSRTAFVTLASTVLISSIALPDAFSFVATQIIAGMVAIYSLRELYQRSQLIRSACYVTLASVVIYFSIELIHERDLTRIDYHMLIYILLGGLLLLFAYPLLFLFEKTFNFTSNVTLVELSNTNNDVLRRLSEVAPGTFQHSMQVANLATEVANRIGAKSLLVRTGALYHDIGKMLNPAYFTENQNSFNPHSQLSSSESATVVINHVRDGLRLAEKYHLPTVISDFIATHHGQGKTKYFLITYKNQHPNEEFDESVYTYPGPDPFTPEQAILMMADAVEAASRSLKEYSDESISNLVDKIIDGQLAEGFFRHCPITFADILSAKETFKEKLKTIYHTRISYPELKK